MKEVKHTLVNGAVDGTHNNPISATTITDAAIVVDVGVTADAGWHVCRPDGMSREAAMCLSGDRVASS